MKQTSGDSGRVSDPHEMAMLVPHRVHIETVFDQPGRPVGGGGLQDVLASVVLGNGCRGDRPCALGFDRTADRFTLIPDEFNGVVFENFNCVVA